MNRQNNIFKIIGLTITILSILISATYTLIAYMQLSTLAPIIFLFIVLGLLIFLTFINNGIVIKKLFLLIKRFKKHPLKGIWNIEISYQNEKNQQCLRTGTCEFIDAALGICIYGGRIFDSATNKLHVESWIAEHVDYHTINNGEKEIKYLIYHYNTYTDKNCNNPIKTGFVIAKEENGVFRGQFQDFIVAEGKVERKGEVRLFER